MESEHTFSSSSSSLSEPLAYCQVLREITYSLTFLSRFTFFSSTFAFTSPFAFPFALAPFFASGTSSSLTGSALTFFAGAMLVLFRGFGLVATLALASGFSSSDDSSDSEGLVSSSLSSSGLAFALGFAFPLALLASGRSSSEKSESGGGAGLCLGAPLTRG
jgi:hypothetical protein